MTEKPKKKLKKPLKGSRRHAAVESLSMFGASTRMGPMGLYLYAENFLSAAKSVQAPVTAPRFPMARTFLVCRSLELALKAFLSLKGISLLELTGGEYGHDLKGLIEQTEKRDLDTFVKLGDDQRAEIIRASTYYFEKVFEYPALMEALRGNPGLPSADVLIGAAEALVSALQEPCRAA